MPGPFVNPVHGDRELPAEVDVVVIGGGIIGASTALELAERGSRVALCEKGGIGHEQSSRNWGWVRITCRDPRELPLMAKAIPLWQTLNKRLGRNTGYTQTGIVFACADDKEYAEHEDFLQDLQPYPVSSRMLSGREFKEMFPQVQLSPAGALYTEDDGCAEPQKVTSAIAEAARERGAHILTECAVRGLDTAAGQVCGVVTERGLIKCQAAVLAGGAWSDLFLGNHHFCLPQLKVMNSVVNAKSLEGGPREAIWSNRFAIRKRQDGGYTISLGHESIAYLVPKNFRYLREFWPSLKAEWRSLKFRLGWQFLDEARIPSRWALDEASPFEYHRVLDPKPDRRLVNKALEQIRKNFPALEKMEIAQSWGGYIDVTPDAIPVISPLEKIPGFFIATGFSGHGFGIGPAAGHLMADMVLNKIPLVDVRDFRFERFS